VIPSDKSLTFEVSPEKLIPVTTTWYYRVTVSKETDKLDTEGTSCVNVNLH
jgi:hypothetical protein